MKAFGAMFAGGLISFFVLKLLASVMAPAVGVLFGFLALAFKVADRFIILRDGLVSDGGFVKSLEGDHDDIVRTIYL